MVIVLRVLLTGRIVRRLVLSHEDPGDSAGEGTQNTVLGRSVMPNASQGKRGLPVSRIHGSV